MQQRLRRFVRQPDHLPNRQITGKSLAILEFVHRYQFLPSSLLVPLTAGDRANTHRHLQQLYHKNLVSRLAFPRIGGSGEFIYFLENPDALRLLIDSRRMQLDESDYAQVRRMKEKRYSEVHRDPDRQGQLLFLNHEVMISRFHAMLELACRKSAGQVELASWRQGPDLWNRVEVDRLVYDAGQKSWFEPGNTQHLPHRPDAFFTLRQPGKPAGEQEAHFFYEADRGTENTRRFKLKLRAHFHYVVKQKLHQQDYGIRTVRAVLIESTSSTWASQLRDAARDEIVSGRSPSPLFWFTTSELFTRTVPHQVSGRSIPLYLAEPEFILSRIWASPAEDRFLSLLDK